MKEILISVKTAKLAKEKKYSDFDCKQYSKDGTTPITGYVYNGISAPTQSLLQKWLREKHEIHIAIMPCILPNNTIHYYIFKGKLKWNWNELFDSYEEALEEALYQALLLIKT